MSNGQVHSRRQRNSSFRVAHQPLDISVPFGVMKAGKGLLDAQGSAGPHKPHGGRLTTILTHQRQSMSSRTFIELTDASWRPTRSYPGDNYSDAGGRRRRNARTSGGPSNSRAALECPCSAAPLSHCIPSSKFRGIFIPCNSRLPSWYFASLCPRAPALRSHCSPWSTSFTVPAPSRSLIASANCASGSPCSALL
jgi:hypothetical protein